MHRKSKMSEYFHLIRSLVRRAVKCHVKILSTFDRIENGNTFMVTKMNWLM